MKVVQIYNQHFVQFEFAKSNYKFRGNANII